MFVLFLFDIFIRLIVIYCYDFYKHVFLFVFFIFVCFVFSLIIIVIIWEKNDIFKTTLIFIHLINGTVLGRALWRANTSPNYNRLPNPYFWFADYFIIFGFSIVFLNKLWCRLQSQFKYFLKLNFDRPVVILVATDGDSTRDILESQANLIK